MACGLTKKNIGRTKCDDIPQLAKYMIWTPASFELDADDLATSAALKTALQTALKDSASERIYLWPAFSRVERADEATVYVESPLGSRKVRNGNYRARHFVAKSLCTHKQMYSHNTTEGRIIYVDLELNMLLTLKSNGNYAGLSLDLLNVEKLKQSTGDDLTESPIYVSLANSIEIDEKGEMFDGSAVLELEPLTSVDLAIVSVADEDHFTLSVTNSCDDVAISGLVAADFSVLTAAGEAQAPDTVTEPNNDGIYLFTKASNFIDGTVNLKAPSLLSLDAYESTGAATVNVT